MPSDPISPQPKDEPVRLPAVKKETVRLNAPKKETARITLPLPPRPPVKPKYKYGEQQAYDEALRRIQICLWRRKNGTYLDLSGFGLTEVPPEIGQLKAVTHLLLHSNRLTWLPPEIGLLNTLWDLSLHDNQLVALPAELGQLTALSSLTLHHNQLEALPAEIGQLTFLAALPAQNNRLTVVPPEIGALKALRKLELSGNQLTTLPPEIGQLRALTELRLENNRLATLPPEIGLLSELRELALNQNQLTMLPQEIGQLTALTTLLLNYNQLTALPPELGRLTALKGLGVHNNRLTALPAEIGQLTMLAQLALFNNQLTGLPTEIGQLTRLEKLWLSDNHLMTLPQEIGQLAALKMLFLHRNPALGLPVEVLGPRWADVSNGKAKPAPPRAILDYCFALKTQGETPIQEVRVLLVGRGRVGKTSLLKALRGEKPNVTEKETPGITVLPLELNCAQGKARAHAWDFGGQEFLHGTHQIFLSERCVYVLVLEGRDGDWELETDYWLRFIQSFGGQSPVIVALNKYDAHAFSVDRFRLLERCPQVVGFVETDVFTSRGIAELRSLLEVTVNGMEHVWLGVPQMWHRVKEALSQMPERFLGYGDYQVLCARLGVEEGQQQDSLAETLHRLGIALNFREHHRLRETSVLKPQWVTEGIYGLLRFAQAKDCHGVLERQWIGEALPAKDYPPDKHDFVMELMEKFEVAFALEHPETMPGQPSEARRWLIPELLPEVQPAAFEEFRAAGVKRLRFTYPQALPPGLLPRLIVRTHELSESHAEWRWRSGVVLEWGSARALVRLDRNERRTDVAVLSDAAEERQSLFDIIRAHLVVLHGKVPVVEEVQALDDPEKWVEMRELRMAEREQDESIKVAVSDDPNVPRVPVPVVKTLDTVESREAREAEGPNPPMRMRLFVSYAHSDERKIKPLSTHLTILGRRGYIQAWDDRQLIAGDEWEERIMAEMAQADLVVLIYSTASRASTFIQDKEGPEAIRLMREKSCTIVVVPLDRKDWDESVELERELKKLQTATWNAEPVLKFKRQWEGWQEVEHAIRNATEARRRLAR